MIVGSERLHHGPTCAKLRLVFRPIRSVVGIGSSTGALAPRSGPQPETLDVDILLFLLIGLAAGWLAGLLVKRRGSGWVEDLIIGVIGALIGGFVFGRLGVNTGGLLGSLISATVGAVILLFLLRFIRKV